MDSSGGMDADSNAISVKTHMDMVEVALVEN